MVTHNPEISAPTDRTFYIRDGTIAGSSKLIGVECKLVGLISLFIKTNTIYQVQVESKFD